MTKVFIHVIVIIMTVDRMAAHLDEQSPIRRVPLAIARRFFQICNTAGAEAVAAADLTPLEFAVIAYVNSTDGEPNLDQNSLASRVGVDRNTISLLVRSLQSKELLEQRVSGTDRRARVIRLTARGEALFAELHPQALARQEQVLAVLPAPERELLLDLLLRVIEENQHLARPGAGRRKRKSEGPRASSN